MTDSSRDRATGKQRILTRAVTLERDGDRLVPVAVCPRRLKLLSVAECGRCASFAGLTVNPDSGAPFMRCAFNDAPFFEPAAEPHSAEPPIADLMTRPPPSVGLDTSLAGALEGSLVESDAVAVAGDDGKTLGLLTRADLLQRLYERSEAAAAAGCVTDAAGAFTARDVTLSPTFLVSPDTPAAQVAALMAYEHVAHVLVVGEAGELLGMVRALDFARWLACRGGYVVPSDR